jgi:hypothetical protein
MLYFLLIPFGTLFYMINEVFRVVPNPVCLVVVEDDELGFAPQVEKV